MRRSLIAALPTGAALLACSSLTGEEAEETPAAAEPAPEAPPADPDGTPLAPTPAPQALGPAQVVAEACRFEGLEILGSSTSLLRSIAVTPERILVVDDQGAVRAFRPETGPAGCKLAVDPTFGQGGTWKAEQEIQHLSADQAGVVVASNGIFGAWTIEGSAVAACDTKGYVELHDSGAWGIAPWVNSTVQQVERTSTGCASKPWVLQDLSDDSKRKGIFASVDASAIVGDEVFIGGSLAKSVDPNGKKIVAVYDRAGKEQRRFGGSDDIASPEMFGWVHDIGACAPGVCVIDSNFRRLTAWGPEGAFVGSVDLKALLGLDYPWIADADMAADGTTWMLAANKRADADVSEGLVYRVTGLGVPGEGAEADPGAPERPAVRPRPPGRPAAPPGRPPVRPGETRTRPH